MWLACSFRLYSEELPGLLSASGVIPQVYTVAALAPLLAGKRSSRESAARGSPCFERGRKRIGVGFLQRVALPRASSPRCTDSTAACRREERCFRSEPNSFFSFFADENPMHRLVSRVFSGGGHRPPARRAPPCQSSHSDEPLQFSWICCFCCRTRRPRVRLATRSLSRFQRVGRAFWM